MTSTYRFTYFWNSACLHFTFDCTWRQSSIKAMCTCIQTWNFYLKLFPRITTFHLIWLILTVTTKRRRRKKVAISYLIPQLSPSRSTNCTSKDMLSVSALGQAVKNSPFWHKSISLYKCHGKTCHFCEYDLLRFLLFNFEFCIPQANEFSF